MKDAYPILVAAFACMGTFLYGVDTGIATTTIAHPSWVEYMKHPSNGLTGSVAAIYIAGEAIGAVSQVLFADRLGRLRFMQLQCVLVTIGCAIQTGSVNIGMFLAGRVLAGIAVGALSGTVPVYLSEISPPNIRGMIGGLNGAGLALGTMVSNWLGFACGYAPYGQVQWRLPLALQIPWGVILFLGLVTFMPQSPRQLIQRGKLDEAQAVFARIRSDLLSDAVHGEFALMKAQIEYEEQREIPSWREMWRLYRHRILVSVSVQVLTSITGVNVIQYYQTSLYKSLGITSNTILALAAVWGTCAFLATAVSIVFLPDRWGRRNMLLAGMAWVVWTEAYSAILQWKFQHSDNKVGKGFALLGIYLFVVGYYCLINPVTWIYGAEVLPIAIRSRVMGIAATCHYVVNVGITEAGPSAFATIGENYYYVFVGCCVVYSFIIYFYYPETKQKTLEGIAAAFGDHVVSVKDDGELSADQKPMVGPEHIE
ncbi:MFS monosaccharide transporter (Hxt8) [Sporothrix brasiliensis 5110]|uniref:MFS monosaccharide transporter (Hxt8) n=1 Tax=Sporothrix brasiliensis 5110 TaxID=1398154 RepID=A0A0C2IR00_9PEZI|nr:MFS monosaccharide transporter (Hxt8) [Sporothrix brasiliensis 5110]KIH87462.1 MFS monosaccharide transporter (Hxt8) [Sporothrix brasiliensis 5110]